MSQERLSGLSIHSIENSRQPRSVTKMQGDAVAYCSYYRPLHIKNRQEQTDNFFLRERNRKKDRHRERNIKEYFRTIVKLL